MRTISGSATAATCQSSRDSVSNGSCVIRKQKKRSQSSVIISSVSFQRTGKRFTRNGWRTFVTGASAVRCGGDIAYRHGTGRQKSETRNPKSEIYVGIEPPPDPENWTQDEDTVDTWFSSWLWAYETMDPKTRKKFYPTSVLVTAAGHHFFLGRAHDHRRARVQTRQIQQG